MAHDVGMIAYLMKVKERSTIVKKFEIKHIHRLENQQADAYQSVLAFLYIDIQKKFIRSVTWMDDWYKRVSMEL